MQWLLDAVMEDWLAVAFGEVGGVTDLGVFQVLGPAKEANLACGIEAALDGFGHGFGAGGEGFMKDATLR